MKSAIMIRIKSFESKNLQKYPNNCINEPGKALPNTNVKYIFQ